MEQYYYPALLCYSTHTLGWQPPLARTQAEQTGLLFKESSQESAPKDLAEIDAIFAWIKQINEESQADEQVLRLSIDAKATVKIGPFACGGKSRVPTKAADHDFQPAATVTLVGKNNYDELSTPYPSSL